MQVAAEPDGAVWPENVAAVRAFLSVQTQFRFAEGFGGRVALGLDYAGAKAGLEMGGLAPTPDLWAQLRLVELGARAALNGEAE